MKSSVLVLRAPLAAGLIYLSWLGMMAVHEFGHALHAWLSGGEVSNVVVPLVGFSRTDLARNPHPQVVAWGGPIWGCLIPLSLLVVVRALKARFRRIVQFFAGFCLIANGVYIGAGVSIVAGDAGDLIRHGTPRWCLVAFGVVTCALGLWLWHGLGPRLRMGKPREA